MAINKIIVDVTTGAQAAVIINETIDLAEANVQSVVAGTNVTVDNTDPNNPIVNAAAGLVSGTGADSMQSDASLTTVAADASSDDSIALGNGAIVTGIGGIALGAGVTAAKVDTVSVKELETQTPGGGITLKSADATEEKVTLTDADVLAVGGDTIPANDTATPTVVNRFWSGTQGQYDALGVYDANTIYYIV